MKTGQEVKDTNMKKIPGDKMRCACCGSPEFAIFAFSRRINHSLRIVKCNCCGFLYTNPLPTQNELEDFYSGYEIPAQWAYGSNFFNHEITSLVRSVTMVAGFVKTTFGDFLDAFRIAYQWPQG